MSRTEPAQALAEAARRAQRAPSILNTQPWRWRVGEDELALIADHDRQLRSIDPNGRLLTMSCGAALHHARAVLAAEGYEPQVQRFPDPHDADLLARLRITGDPQPRQDAAAVLSAIRRRHTDRRPFAATVPVPESAIVAMTQAAEQEDAQLHRVPADQVSIVDGAAEQAAAAEARMPAYAAELHQWTHRPRASGEGVSAEAMVAPIHRRVHMRDLTAGGEALLDPGFGDDRCTEYFILATPADTRHQWLRAGEAMSAVWLAATAADLVVSVMSDITEIPPARALVQRLLHPAGCPQLVFRVGVDMQATPPPESPRRPPDVAGPVGAE